MQKVQTRFRQHRKTIQERQSWDKDKTREWIIACTEQAYDSHSRAADEERKTCPKQPKSKKNLVLYAGIQIMAAKLLKKSLTLRS